MNSSKIIIFLSYWIANNVVLIVFSMVLAGQIVLGNAIMAMPMAAVLAGLILTGVGWAVEPVMKKAAVGVKDERILGIVYLVVNIVTLWIIKKLAIVTGVGISNNFYLVIVSVVLTAAQFGVFKYVGPWAKKR